ncbi:hypothetical protein [Inquilinus limosus]|uniref:hypothetical protein n=1 Tax=Inquilinus limosus TaxID=171674 RepID=UPI0011981E1A|nr:hypothetical protein [Inquilinus limosus]
MSAELRRAKERYERDRDTARREAALNLRPHLAVDFRLSGWTGKTLGAYFDQWGPADRHPDGDWDWPEIIRRHNDADRLDIAIWGPDDRLCGLALGLTKGRAIEIRYVEGDPRADCPLTGRRILIVLECAAIYAQAMGKAELHVQPVNASLVDLYQVKYGFTLASPRKQSPYYWKKV